MKKKLIIAAASIILIVALVVTLMLASNEKEDDKDTTVGDVHITTNPSKSPSESQAPSEPQDSKAPADSKAPIDSKEPQGATKEPSEGNEGDKTTKEPVATTPPYHIPDPDTMITDGYEWVIKDVIATTTAPDGSKVDIYEDGYTFCLAYEKGNKSHVNPVGRMVIFEVKGKGLELKDTISESIGKNTWNIKVPSGYKSEVNGSNHIYIRNENTQFFILEIEEYKSMFDALEEFKAGYEDDGYAASARQKIFYKYKNCIYEIGTKTSFLDFGFCKSYDRSWEGILNWYTGDRFIPETELIFNRKRGVDGPTTIRTYSNGFETSFAELKSKEGKSYLVIGISDKYTEEEMLWTSKLMCESITTGERKEDSLKEITSADGSLRLSIPDYFKDKSADGTICYEAQNDSPYPGTGIMIFTGKNLSFEQMQTEFNKEICRKIYFEHLSVPVFEPRIGYTSAEEFAFGENGWVFGTDINIYTENAMAEREAKYDHGLIGYTYIFKHNSTYKLVCIYSGPDVMREDFDALSDTIMNSLK